MDQTSHGHGVVPAPVRIGRERRHAARDKPGAALRNAAEQASSEVSELQRTFVESQRQLRAARQQVNRLMAANARLRREVLQGAHREARAESLAYYDQLTKLPNRRLLLDRIKQAMARSTRQRSKIALVWLDLDGFKGVNDWLGHAAGDRLLTEVAQRLGDSIRASDTACRYGGDEFTVMLADVDSAHAVAAVAATIRSRLCAPYRIDDCEICITVSVGTAIFPDDGQTAEDLMAKADASMYQRKPSSRAASITPLLPKVGTPPPSAEISTK